VYGSDNRLVSYAPHGFLSSLRQYIAYQYNNLDSSGDLHVAHPEPNPTVAAISTPYIDNNAPEAIDPDNMDFRLLDIVKIAGDYGQSNV
jgi:hypothetical protein